MCADDGYFMNELASSCCSDSVSVCDDHPGTCFRGDSTVKVRAPSLRTTVTTPLTELKVGDMVLSKSLKKHESWSRVTALHSSKSAGDWVELRMEGSQESVAVTAFHTFPTCHHEKEKRKMVIAKSLKPGDCLFTAGGEKSISHVRRKLAEPNDRTFTVQLEGNQDEILLNGVVTHTQPQKFTDSTVAKKYKLNRPFLPRGDWARDLAGLEYDQARAKFEQKMSSKAVKQLTKYRGK